MKPNRKHRKLRITEADFMLANRRAARQEEIAGHGRPVSFRPALHKSKKVYDRKRLKRTGINEDGCPFCICKFFHPTPCRLRKSPFLVISRVRIAPYLCIRN